MPLCDGCFEQLSEEAFGNEDIELLTMFGRESGQDIADHECDYRIGKDEEREGEVKCDCSCDKRYE